MLKKIALTCCIAAGLSACKQEVVGTIYVRDLQEVVDSKKDIPIDVLINVYEMGIAKKCNDPKSQELVKAVAAQFQSATLAGCETIQGSMRDRMTIKATTVLNAPETNQVGSGKYLFQFDAFKSSMKVDGKDVPGIYVSAHFDRDKYEAVRKAVRAVDMMANIDLSDVEIKVTLNNDLRKDVMVYPSIGLFVDGEPVDNNGASLKLEPRKESEHRFGNVKAAFLTKYQWGSIATVTLDEITADSKSE